MKIYSKKGNYNFKERRMLKSIEVALTKKFETNPDFQIETANNITELEALWKEHCTEEINFTEVNNTSEPEIEQEIAEKDTPETNITDNDNSGVDPFNRDEPIVRDYVKGTDFPGDKAKISNQNIYGEPQTKFDQMQMPDDSSSNNTQSETKNQSYTPPKNQQKTNSTTNSQPVNPAFNEMSDSQKKKQTIRMAKSVVRLVCALYEKGIIWWGTMNIAEAKLQELQMSGELDLSFMLSLSEEQEVQVKDFFATQRLSIEQIGVITAEEKEILIESLTEVMLEKGIGPTPMQVLLLNIAEIFGVRFLQVYAIQKQNKDLIVQLKEITANQKMVDDINNTPTPEEPLEKFVETGLTTT